MPERNLSQVEQSLLDSWNEGAGPSLRSIEISGNGIRGLQSVTVDFPFPLTAIAGKNGVGKSTILACAACAYQNKTPFAGLLTEEQYYNFNHFLVRGWGDAPLQNVTVKWTYRDQAKTIQLLTATKERSSWKYPRQPDRPDRCVDFIGTIRGVHPCELTVLHKKFGASAPITELPADNQHRVSASRIIGVDYSGLRVGKSGKYKLHRLEVGASGYSGFNAGSGEEISCLLGAAINRLPRGSLLVVEEIETGLHASAQRRLASMLLQHCHDRKIQVICSTHSATFLEALPREARVLLVRSPGNTEVIQGVTVEEATSDMIERPVPELVICLEDKTARQLVWELLPSRIRNRVRLAICGSWENVLRQVASFRRDRNLGEAAAILDGERQGKEIEHIRKFAGHVGGQDAALIGGCLDTAQDQHQADASRPVLDIARGLSVEPFDWFLQRHCILPGSLPPESWLWELGRGSELYRRELVNHFNAEEQDIAAFFAGNPPANHHDLPFLLSQKVGNDANWVLNGLCKAAVKTEGVALTPVLDFIKARLQIE